jgi:dipeptidyl aminopeptidase/acylaminoacyl peptidase
MLHGERDRTAPLAQSQTMEAALKAAGRDVRLMVMPGEGHADWSPAHEAEALTAVTEFLKASIGD